MSGIQNSPPKHETTAVSTVAPWLLLGILPALMVPLGGCRTPPQHSFSSEPSFERLLEIEQAITPDPARTSQAASRRPGGSKPPGMPISLAAQDASQRDEFSPTEYDLLQQTEIALRNAKDRNLSSKPDSREVAVSARRTISDAPDHEARPETAAVGFKMSDSGTLELTELKRDTYQDPVKDPAKGQLADRASSSRRPETRVESTARNEFENRETGERESSRWEADDTVRYASANRPVNSRDAGDRAEEHTKRADVAEIADYSWEDHIRAAITQLKESNDSALSPEIRLRHSATLRLLSLTTGDLDAAMQPIDGLQPNEQDYFHHQFQALHDSIDPEGNPVSSRRWSLAMLSQRKALEHLAAVSNLEVNNAAFCTDVESFGVVSKFPDYKFKSDQELLLYCELDNFTSETVKTGYETQLQGSYEIVDTSGRRLADQLLPMDSHICRNRRRDYFIAYHIYMPQNVAAGNYTLKLTIEDMKGRKFGQSELDFQIVD